MPSSSTAILGPSIKACDYIKYRSVFPSKQISRLFFQRFSWILVSVNQHSVWAPVHLTSSHRAHLNVGFPFPALLTKAFNTDPSYSGLRLLWTLILDPTH